MTKQLLILFVALATLFGCSKSNDPEPESVIKSISFNSKEIELIEGQSEILVISHFPENLTSPSYEITSSDNNIAKVEGLKVIALNAGTATITAISKGTTLKTEIKITVLPVAAEKLIVKANKEVILVGETSTLSYTIEPPNTTNINNLSVEWASSDDNIAKVSAGGVISGISVGDVEITGKIKGTSIIGKITIKVNPVLVESVSFEQKSITLEVGGSSVIKYNVLPANATDKTVKLESLDESIAAVSNGVIIAKAEGETKIKITSNEGNKEDVLIIKVNLPKVSTIILDKSNLKLTIGESSQIYATVSPSNAKDKTLTWTSSNPLVATVDEKGVVKAISKGFSVISVKSNSNPEIISSCSVQVVEDIDLVQSYISSRSIVSINGFVTGNITSVLANYSNSPIKYKSYEVKNINNVVISFNNETQEIAPGTQLSLTSRLNSVDTPRIIFKFEINGKAYERVLTLD